MASVVNAVSKESVFSPLDTNAPKKCGLSAKGLQLQLVKRQLHSQTSFNEN